MVPSAGGLPGSMLSLLAEALSSQPAPNLGAEPFHSIDGDRRKPAERVSFSSLGRPRTVAAKEISA